MTTTEDYIDSFQAIHDTTLDLWDATWGMPHEVIAATRIMHVTVVAAFELPAGMLSQSTLNAMSAAAEDSLLELRSVVPDIFCGDGYGDSARLVFESIKMLEDHLVHHPAPLRQSLPTSPAYTPELVH